MKSEQRSEDLSVPVKIYVFLLHTLLLFLVVLLFKRTKRDVAGDKLGGNRKTRTVTKANRAVTIESCQWLNSTLAWFYLHSCAGDTPNLVKIWLRAMNRQLHKDRKSGTRITIDDLRPGCLPPILENVYCLCVNGNMQCITFHVETKELGFLLHVTEESPMGPKTTHLEVNVVRIVGEVALQLSTSPSRLEVSIKFMNTPEIVLSSKCLKDSKDGSKPVNIEEVQEKVKDVICKTVTNIPLSENTSKEKLSDIGSAGSTERLQFPTAATCLTEEGKLLVKVVKASGLCGKENNGTISPYCVVSTNIPLQKKRTSMMKNTNSPFWNEYFTFDITPKTKEITLDFYDYEKTGKDDYLGQVIVPLSTVNRDQTCRLILPVLPRSTLSEHAKGDINLEFTFDKDGKIIDGVLPLVESTGPAADAEKSSPQNDPRVLVLNGYTASPQLNGHSPTNKRKLDVSLEDLVLEIEACDTMEVQPGTSAEQPQVKEDESKAKEIPSAVDTEDAMTALEILDSDVGPDTHEVGPDTSDVCRDTSEVGPDTSEGAEPAIVQPRGEDKVDSEEPSTSAVQEEPRFKEYEEGARVEQEQEEEEKGGVEEDRKREEEMEGEREQEGGEGGKIAQEEEDKQKDELKAFEVKPERKSKLRNSFKKFKRRPQSTIAGDKKESAEKGALRGSDPCLTTQDKEPEAEEEGEDEDKDKFESKPTEDKQEPKPKRRSRLKIRRRPASMAAADRKEAENGENFHRDDTTRHSYHAGDLGEPSNLQKAGSQTSLLSYSPCAFSTLVIESTEKGEHKYFHIPQDMARRATYEQKGAKLHVYNDHVFAAVHFSGNVPECAVCSKVLSRWVGKQGYQCRGCSMVTHKDCHYQTSVMCPDGAAKKLDIDYLDDTDV